MGERLDEIVMSALAAVPEQDRPDGVSSVVMKGGPAHEDRALVLLFPERGRWPFAVAKVAFDNLERHFLRTEHMNLRALWPFLDSPMSQVIPRPLAFQEQSDAVWLIETAVVGRRILVPYLGGSGGYWANSLTTRFLRRTYRWSRRLADLKPGPRYEGADFGARIDYFITIYDPPNHLQRDLRAFASRLSKSQMGWVTSWQHGDLSVGNVLYNDSELVVLDWEHASDGRPPWYDAVNSVVLMASLAQRQTGAGSLIETASWVLDESHWVGSTMARELREIWDYPVPLGWGIAIGLVEAAITRYESRRTQWPEWGEMLGLLFQRRLDDPSLGWMQP